MNFSCCSERPETEFPFDFHVNTQIEADTLYLVCINPGNQDQEFSTIIYPMSLCGANAVNKKEIKELHTCLLWAFMCWHM